jgi:hypothetical protein
MTRSLSVLSLIALLAIALPLPSLADATEDECRRMAVEDEVAPEDLDDYIAECIAVVQSESADDAEQAMDRPDTDTPDSDAGAAQPKP